VKPAPEFGSVLDTQYILGLATVEGQLLIITDIEKLMGAREMALVSDAAEGA
jgi:purine-binding chemotaxis protein CheW